MEEKLVKILNEMAEYLSISQMKKLQEGVWRYTCWQVGSSDSGGR